LEARKDEVAARAQSLIDRFTAKATEFVDYLKRRLADKSGKREAEKTKTKSSAALMVGTMAKTRAKALLRPYTPAELIEVMTSHHGDRERATAFTARMMEKYPDTNFIAYGTKNINVEPVRS
jgi:hypothetical protein